MDDLPPRIKSFGDCPQLDEYRASNQIKQKHTFPRSTMIEFLGIRHLASDDALGRLSLSLFWPARLPGMGKVYSDPGKWHHGVGTE